jgi:hypothetical protein
MHSCIQFNFLWQCFKKLYHAIGINGNPEDFGFTQAELRKIAGTGGVVQYVREGGEI